MDLTAWTYARQRLGGGAPDAATALRDVVGVYSAHPSAPLSLHARAHGMDAAAFRALDGLRVPAMRQSIHLMPRDSAPLAFAATLESPAARARRLRTFGLDEERFLVLREQVLAAVADGPLTQAELHARLGDDGAVKGTTATMTRFGELVRIGADGLRSNVLRYGPGPVPPADPDAGLAWLVGAYLRAFGPARLQDVVWWTGVTKGRVRTALATHDVAELEGGLLLLGQDVPAWEAGVEAPDPGAVDLLPKWDAWTMGHAPDGRARLFGRHDPALGYDFRGDGLALVLVGGTAAGTWGLAKGKGVGVEVTWFDGAPPRAGLDAAVGRLRSLLA